MGDAMECMIVEGQTMVRHNDGPLLLHTEHTEIGPDRVHSQVVGIGSSAIDVPPVISTNPAVIAYERAKAEARELSAHINRSITPLFKSERDRRASKRQQTTWDQSTEAGT